MPRSLQISFYSHTRWARSRRMDGGEYKRYWCSDTWREAMKSINSRKSLRVVAYPSIAGTVYNDIPILYSQWGEQSLYFGRLLRNSKRIIKRNIAWLFGLDMLIQRMVCGPFSQIQSLFYPSIVVLSNNLNSLFRELHAMCYWAKLTTNLINEIEKRRRRQYDKAIKGLTAESWVFNFIDIINRFDWILVSCCGCLCDTRCWCLCDTRCWCFLFMIVDMEPVLLTCFNHFYEFACHQGRKGYSR